MDITAQQLEKHRWKNRLVLIITDNVESKLLKDQIKELKNNNRGLEDRKLVTYIILPKKYKIEIQGDSSWIESSNLFERYNSENETFKVILIGLDGSIKLEQNNILAAKKLFSTIDAMPMRQSELKNR
ncbi:DUF4174 domain-containing protein [Winogradskyella ursingii]|uniref:DUF4174 domain-containing protein n=1 Tax=Winogradskyella ursingii TaxID=2686079 RepID=UPI0015CC72E1|nr:DUF4174 domain-containing protein [Winogradskyella ursingii]